MIDAARKPETNKPGQNPALLPQDPTVCQTLNHPSPNPPFQDTPTKEDIRTEQEKKHAAAIR
ncbi:hypothetical protein ACFWIX_16030 [Pseudarthrobacter sp. NPDC058362]|uniref:hypothetical protein n=1 Tax=Pseudarthrobacter sp. NPDC058362 TaxID=3346458 RepID=UPI003668ADD2